MGKALKISDCPCSLGREKKKRQDGKVPQWKLYFCYFFFPWKDILKFAYYRPHPPAEMKVAVGSLISCSMSCLCGKRYIIQINYFSCITVLCSCGVLFLFIYTHTRHTHIRFFFKSITDFQFIFSHFPYDLRSWIRVPFQTEKHTKHSISNSTTNLCNDTHYEKPEQYCPLVGLFLLSVSALSNFYSAHLNNSHYHRGTFINTCFSLCTGKWFWSINLSCGNNKGHWGILI